MLAIGLVAGRAGAALASGLLSDTLRYVEPRDGLTYVAVALAVLGVGIVAAWIPRTPTHGGRGAVRARAGTDSGGLTRIRAVFVPTGAVGPAG